MVKIRLIAMVYKEIEINQDLFDENPQKYLKNLQEQFQDEPIGKNLIGDVQLK